MTRSRNLQPATRNLLTLLLLCTIAVIPLLRSDVPCTHDGPLHYYRVAQLHHLIQEGGFFSRWLPDLAFGYGYPFFNYREPLSLYLSLGIYLLGFSLPVAFNLVYVLCIVGSAVGAYLLARDLFSAPAGFVAAVAYAYAPYQFLDALLRGNLLESVALALFPLILWAFRRLVVEGGRRWFVISVLLLVALLLTHNISSLIFVPFLTLYLGIVAWSHRAWRRGVWAVVALGLAMGLTAFFWLPALAEQDVVQLHMSRVTRNNDFHYNFLGLGEILAPPAAFDTSLMNPSMTIHLGLVQAALAAAGFAGVLAWARGKRAAIWRERRSGAIFFAVFTLIFIFMSTEASLWLWEHVPLMPFIQFPWRFVGRAALPAALLTAALVPTLSSMSDLLFAIRNSTPKNCELRIANTVVPLFIIGALILTALPNTYPPLGYCTEAPYPTIQDVHRYERESRLVGVDPEGSYFPIWVEQRPTGSPLEVQYGEGGPIERFDESTLPAGAALLSADYAINRAELDIETPVPFQARYFAFYYPGWRVQIDGEPVAITPSDSEGLITFAVPSGRHTVALRFGETPLRRAADAISLLSLLLLLLFTLAPLRPGEPAPLPARAPAPLLLCALAALLLAFKLFVVDATATPFRRPSLVDGTLPGVSHVLDQPYADGLTLIGFDRSAQEIPADGSLRLDLYWTARLSPSRDVQATVYLVGPDGLRWSPQDSFRPRGYHDPWPAFAWTSDVYALDSHVVEPLPGTPPGDYHLVVTLFDRETLAPLSILDAAGQPAAPELVLGDVTLTAPRRPADLPARDRVDLPLAELTLLTAAFDRTHAAPGDAVYLTLLWQADQAPPVDYGLRLTLQDAGDTPAAVYDVPPATAWHPTSNWQAGDVWRGQHRFDLPAALESGDYAWTAQLTDCSVSPCLPLPSSHAHTIGRLTVTAPERTFTPPPVQLPIDVTLGDLATLLGLTIQSNDLPPASRLLTPASSFTTTLVWRAEATTTSSYRVFLHLLTTEGRIVAQSDGIPVNWSRPTTGWLPGEILVDERVLTLPADTPAGRYTLSAGIYLPGGARLTAPDGSDAIQLLTIVVEAP
ncbi:MAG: glycosyltransferase family 39 protein [Anaerolineae bacterium]|nr:glycosyltransferase family 39 protein [Anaerolineae bacterium]